MDWSLMGFSALKELYNVHPAFVHFPIGLLPAALLLYFFGTVMKKPVLNAAGRACLYMGTAGAALAVLTGNFAENSFPHTDLVHVMMETHSGLASTVLVMAIALSLWSFWQSEHRPRFTWAFLALLGLANLGVMLAADIGARMVYAQGAAVKPAVDCMEKSGILRP